MKKSFADLLYYKWQERISNRHTLLQALSFSWECLKHILLIPILYLLLAFWLIKDGHIIQLSFYVVSLSLFLTNLTETTLNLRRNNINLTYEILGKRVSELILAIDLTINLPYFLGVVVYLSIGNYIFFNGFLNLFLLILVCLTSFLARNFYLQRFYTNKYSQYRLNFFQKNFNLTTYFILVTIWRFLNGQLPYRQILAILLIVMTILVGFHLLRRVLKKNDALYYWLIELKISFYESGGVPSGILISLISGPILAVIALWFLRNNASYFSELNHEQFQLVKYMLISLCMFLLPGNLFQIFAYDVEKQKMLKLQYFGNFWHRKFQVKLLLASVLEVVLSVVFVPVVFIVDSKFWQEFLLITLALPMALIILMFLTIVFKDFEIKKISYMPKRIVFFLIPLAEISLLIPYILKQYFSNFMSVLCCLLLIVFFMSIIFYRLSNVFIKESERVK